MTAKTLQRYRDDLLQLGRRLDHRQDAMSGDALRPSGATSEGSTINGPGDSADLSVDTSTQDVSLSLLDTERQLLGQVAAALGRIDDGTFGRCTECGCAIAPERLEAVPYTPHCISCAAKVQAEADRVPAA